MPIITTSLAVLFQFDAAYTLHCVYKVTVKLEITPDNTENMPLKSQA